ncbi:MAG: SGNH/GDSL hydrolase family protein [Candidatus Omnitrophica bacterium]|nr:SGNH/GDSL hydrolase family protein [Candidatus Omnitrophota bacterium]
MNKLLAAILTVTISIVLTLIAAEAVIAVVKPAPTICKIDVSTDFGAYVLSTNRKLVYVGKPNGPGMNRYGLRGKEYPLQKGNKKRIVFMGDSVTDGLNVSGRFTDLLERTVGNTYDIINFAVNGYNLIQEAEYLKELGVKFAPDYVLFIVCANDLDVASGIVNTMGETKGSGGLSLLEQYRNAQGLADDVFSRSNIYRYIKAVAISRQAEKKIADEGGLHVLTRPDVDAALHQINDLARQYHFKPIFVFVPQMCDAYEVSRMAEYHAALQDQKAPILDLDVLTDRLMPKPQKYRLFLGGSHWHYNESGHRFVAALLLDFIRSGGLDTLQ